MPEQPTPAGRAGRGTSAWPGVRWWPLWLIFILAGAALLWVWLGRGPHRQSYNEGTAIIVFSTLVALLVWWIGLSRLPWRTRLAGLGAAFVCAGLTAALVRIRGFTGDLSPIFEWRWKASTPNSKFNPDSSPRPAMNPAPPGDSGAEDYPQFLGPHRTATIEGPHLARDWQTQPPVQLWRQVVGPAWSGFAIAGRYAVTQEQQGANEIVAAYDLFTGKRLWEHRDEAHFQSTLAGEGPRATPTIAGKMVFAVGATGRLNCLDLATGGCLWTKDIVQDNQAKVPEWGMSGSPLLLDRLVVVCPGGTAGRSLVAYRAENGEFAWGGGTDHAGYSSPCVTTLQGMRQALIFNQGGLVAHTPERGEVLWRYPWPGGHPHVAMPVILPQDRVLVSSGYGTGAELLQVRKDPVWSGTRLWKSRRLKAKFTNVVYRDGYIYGLDDGTLVCLDAVTGERLWKGERYGHGQVILTRDLLLLMAEPGYVVLLQPVPQAPRELTRFSVFRDKTWNPPALAGPYLLVRNDKEAACFRLPVLPAPARPRL